MKKYILLLCTLFAGLLIKAQTVTITPPSSYTFLSSSSGISFVLDNTNPYPITVTSVSGYQNVASSGATYILWYSATALSGSSTVQAPAWTQVATTTPPAISASGVYPLFPSVSVNVPANTQYRFCIQSSNRTDYGGASSNTTTFSNAGVTLYIGNFLISSSNVGYSGSGNPVSLGTSPRFFHGSVTFTGGGPCVAPPTPGTATASMPSVCAGTAVNLGLTGNSQGTGQTYQWQSSTTATGSYSDIGSSSSTASTTINPTTDMYYRCAVTCGGNTQYSVPVPVTIIPPFPPGNYTINSANPTAGTNFQSFTDAINAMLFCGIGLGNIVFDVEPGSGPYNEQIKIPSTLNTSAGTTVTFNCNGATLNYTSSSAERAGIKLDGADWITFNDLTINASGTYGYCVQMLNDADNNTINQCTLNTSTSSTSTTNYAGIVISGSATSPTTAGSNCDNIVLSNNTITGGYYGISIVGNSTTARLNNCQIKNNLIQDFYYYGINANSHTGLLVEGNEITRPDRTSVSNFYGIVLTTVTNSKVSKNRLHNSNGSSAATASTCYPIFLDASDATAAEPNIVSNNLIYNINTNTGTVYGIHNAGSDYLLCYYNTIVLDNAVSASGTTRGLYQVTTATGIEFKNNLVYITRGGSTAKYGLYKGTAATVIAASNNCYYINSPAAGTNFIGFSGSDRATLAAWQSATSQDANSITTDPVFASVPGADFTPTNISFDGKGMPIPIISTDIEQKPRHVLHPDIGAVENLPPCYMPIPVVSNIKYDAADINWLALTGSSGTQGYEYALTTSPVPPVILMTPTSDTFYNATGLAPTTTYYFHVRNKCGTGDFSEWRTVSFVTYGFCIQPGSPVIANVTVNNADISWVPVTGATAYEYEVTTSAIPPASGTLTATTLNYVDDLLPGTLYYVHVRTRCAPSQNYSLWTTASFTTPNCIPTSAPVVSNIGLNGASINWLPVPGSWSYEYEISTNPAPPASGTYIAGTSYNATGLTAGTTYYVHVRNKCSATTYSGWATASFATNICTPVNITVSNISYTGATLSWQATSESSGYEYVVNMFPAEPSSGASVTGTTVSVGSLQPNTTYYAHVRSKCNGVTYSEWSNQSFTTGVCAMPVGAIASNITASSASISWAASPDAVSYQYEVSTNGLPPSNGTSTTATGFDLNGLLPEINYHIHLRAICTGNIPSEWSASMFRTFDPTDVSNIDTEHNGIQVYPNPVKDVLTVIVTEPDGEILLQNITGRIIKRLAVKQLENQFSMVDLAPGIYILQYINPSLGRQTIRIVRTK